MHKWTLGELRRIVHENERGAAIEVVKYLCERGPAVVAWNDETDPEAIEEARLERALADGDA